MPPSARELSGAWGGYRYWTQAQGLALLLHERFTIVVRDGRLRLIESDACAMGRTIKS